MSKAARELADKLFLNPRGPDGVLVIDQAVAPLVRAAEQHANSCRTCNGTGLARQEPFNDEIGACPFYGPLRKELENWK